MLGPEQSAKQRQLLQTELSALSSLDESAEWAKRILPIKNTLMTEHAAEIEVAFERVVARFSDLTVGAPSPELSNVEQAGAQTASGTVAATPNGQSYGPARRYRDKQHLRFVASQPCMICQRVPCDAHHLRFAQPKALGHKVSDQFTVPLCRTHHRQVHRTGNEVKWWSTVDPNLNPLEVAEDLWRQSRMPSSVTKAL